MDAFADLKLQRKIRSAATVFLAIAILTGILGLAGWIWDINGLRRPIKSIVAINPLTAVLLIFAGLGQWCAQHLTRHMRTIGILIGFCVTGVALAKLLQVTGFLHFAVDRLLFPYMLEHDLVYGIPNRMAPNTAFCFFWLGLSIALQSPQEERSLFPAQLMLVPVALASALSILGYLYHVPHFYGVVNYIPMALHTAMAFMSISLAIITAYPERGILRHFTTNLAGSRVARWLIPATIIVPVLLGFLRLLSAWNFTIPVEFGVATLVLSIMIVLTALVWFNTRALNLKDREQATMRSELAQINANLDLMVRERTRAAMRTETRLKQVLDAMSEGFQMIGFDWKYIYVNDAVARQAKVPKEDLLNSTFLELYSTGANADLMEAFHRCFKSRESFHMENKFYYPDGSTGWFDLHFQAIPEGLFILSSDITHRKHAEEQVQRLNEQLEHKIAMRTEQLEALNKELNSFCYSVSHDLKAPLRALTSFVHMLAESAGASLPGESRRLLGFIEQKSQWMEQLITDLLHFSQMGVQDIKPVELDMNRLVADVLQEILPEKSRRVTLRIRELDRAFGDAALIRQVWVNLLGNAVKYSAGKPDPQIEIYSEAAGDLVNFHVRDNGAGFDMAYADQLFGAFQRLHSSSEFEGTGVGLAIVQRIIHRHGGKVSAEAAPDSGALFTFSLPTSPDAKS